MEDRKKRLDELSLCNLFFCAMVLLLHIFSDTVAFTESGSIFYTLVFLFWKLFAVAVYGFLFLGGLKACMGRRTDLKTYYLRRAKTVLLPYLVWSVLYLLLQVLRGNPPSPKSVLVQLLLGSSAPHLYFVIAIVQFYALIPLWRRMVDRLSPAIVLPLLAGAAALLPDLLTVLWQRFLPNVPIYLDRCFLSYLFIWCAGCYAGAQYERFSESVRQARWFLWIAALLITAVYLYCGYQNVVNHVWYSFLTPLQQLYFAAASVALFALSQCCTGWMRPWFMQALDRASYQIYLGHMLPLLLAPAILSRLGITASPLLQLLLRALIVLVPTLGLSLLWQALRSRQASR